MTEGPASVAAVGNGTLTASLAILCEIPRAPGKPGRPKKGQAGKGEPDHGREDGNSSATPSGRCNREPSALPRIGPLRQSPANTGWRCGRETMACCETSRRPRKPGR